MQILHELSDESANDSARANGKAYTETLEVRRAKKKVNILYETLAPSFEGAELLIVADEDIEIVSIDSICIAYRERIEEEEEGKRGIVGTMVTIIPWTRVTAIQVHDISKGT